MKISGIISEFNPFHNGHKYLIKKTKEESDAVICAMSGSFVQRGDVAIFDKWLRAKAALINGADLIIEIPSIFSVSTAERFAYGSVELLNSTDCVDEIVFGSESGDINNFISTAEIIYNEPAEVSDKLKELLRQGIGFPSAREKAFQNYIPENILNTPNNILGVEYLISALKLKSNISFRTIKRIGEGYHSTDTNSDFAGATAVRNCIYKNTDYQHMIPKNTFSLYKNADIYTLNALNDIIVYLLRISSQQYLSLINDVTEGIENRLKYCAGKYDNIHDIINNTAGKRYTKTKIMRILISLLLQIDKEIIRSSNSYIRILGFNNTGREILKKMKKTANIPIITKTADYANKDKIFLTDIKSTDIASLCTNNSINKISGKDFLYSPVYIDA